MNEQKTVLWWRLLSALAAGNLLLWLATAALVDAADPYTGWHLRLAGLYTAVCAFRSFVPRIDLERYCLLDSWVSSMALGRSAATVAEICFAVQVALVIHEFGGNAGLPWMQSLAPVIVVLLTVAQGFCWSSVITLSHLGHAIEESLWAITFTGVGISLGVAAPLLDGVWSTVGYAGAAFCAGYVVFMATVDVPMYVRRWRASLAAGERRLGFAEGLADAIGRRVVTRDWVIWKPEVAWLTGYFTGAVWLSLAMVWLPR